VRGITLKAALEPCRRDALPRVPDMRKHVPSRFVLGRAITRPPLVTRIQGLVTAGFFDQGLFQGHDAAKADVIRPSVDFAFATGPDNKTAAVLTGERKGAPALASLMFVGLGRVEGCLGTARVVRHATGLGQLLIVIRAIPVAAPSPNIARHVV